MNKKEKRKYMKKFILILITFVFLNLSLYGQKIPDEHYYKIMEKLKTWEIKGKENETAEVLLIIDIFGNLDTTILKKGETEEFNKALVEYVKELKKIKYPVYKKEILKSIITIKNTK